MFSYVSFSTCSCNVKYLRHIHCFFIFYVVLSGVPAAGSRASHSAGAGQQTVPPPGPGEPNRRRQQAESHGPRGEPEVGQPAEEGGCRPPQTQGEPGSVPR